MTYGDPRNNKFLRVIEDPIPKPRPRVTRTGHAYTPTAALEAERRIRAAWVEQFGTDAAKGPVRMHVRVYLKMPASIAKKRQATARPVKRPDVDNYAKLALDALNGVAYLDDSQVVTLTVHKTYGMPQGWQIHVEEIMDGVTPDSVTWAQRAE